MSFAALGGVNWLAVIVAALVYLAIGGLWFSNFAFGRQWRSAVGWPEGKARDATPPETYVTPAVTCLLSTVALAWLARATSTDNTIEGLVLGVVTSAGLVAAAVYVAGFYDLRKPRPRMWMAINGAYHVVGIIAASIIVADWN
ncbi:DUF1761 domain-containing protein [Kribbella sp. VKM Ac-2566]|uniref:DUF1761 domain-containing protein n=1 Tax=Kribbella sp. VKM Ac-2566 TaxID=2512218 RepID=UPI001062F855|nr:DUF1761 domain-containing protein [Kribbella sp. VKM Ac-2566]TDX08243.1 uncharacterized protein DUF1761 [Kribbella sp. VKM Ac-2566]